MRNVLILTTLLAATCLSGCIERKLTITSEPAGALVIISDKEIGRTPVTTTWTWHGEYDIILRYPEKGYETLNESAKLSMRWYEIPPIDLLSYMAPWTYKDHRYLHYNLQKLELPSDDELIRRAKEMERRNNEVVEK